MSKHIKKIAKVVEPAKKHKRRLLENEDFSWAGWPRQYPVPLFTWEELNQIIEKNNNKIPDNMWKERMKRKGDHP